MSRLIRPHGFTEADTRHVAVAFAGIVVGVGAGNNELAALLREIGILHDPDQLSPAHLGLPRTHPYGAPMFAFASEGK